MSRTTGRLEGISELGILRDGSVMLYIKPVLDLILHHKRLKLLGLHLTARCRYSKLVLQQCLNISQYSRLPAYMSVYVQSHTDCKFIPKSKCFLFLHLWTIFPLGLGPLFTTIQAFHSLGVHLIFFRLHFVGVGKHVWNKKTDLVCILQKAVRNIQIHPSIHPSGYSGSSLSRLFQASFAPAELSSSSCEIQKPSAGYVTLYPRSYTQMDVPGTPLRCPNHLNWLLSTPRNSKSTPSSVSFFFLLNPECSITHSVAVM